MYSDLYRYLIRYNELPLPGIGTFSVYRQPAMIDFTGRKINGPVYSIQFQKSSYLPPKHFFNWLSHSKNISDREAVFLFNDFAFEMKQHLEKGVIIKWNGVGELKKTRTGELILKQDELIREESIPAEKIIREKFEHMVRVGEDEKTSAQMTELLSREETKKSNWWIWALGLAVLAMMFIGWYLSENGLEIQSVSNNSSLIPSETPAGTYKVQE